MINYYIEREELAAKLIAGKYLIKREEFAEFEEKYEPRYRRPARRQRDHRLNEPRTMSHGA